MRWGENETASSDNRWWPQSDGIDEVVCLQVREEEGTEKRRCTDRAVCWWSWQLARRCTRASEQQQNLSQWLLALLLMKTRIRTWRERIRPENRAGKSASWKPADPGNKILKSSFNESFCTLYILYQFLWCVYTHIWSLSLLSLC